MKRKTYRRLMRFLCIMLFIGIGLVIFGLVGMVVELLATIDELQPTKEPKIQPIPPMEEKPEYKYLKGKYINETIINCQRNSSVSKIIAAKLTFAVSLQP